MEVIVSHVNIDFDGLSSILAAKKLHPHAEMVISSNQSKEVTRFMAIFRDKLSMIADHQVDWTKVQHMILVDVSHLHRVGSFTSALEQSKVTFTVYDHHPVSEGHVPITEGIVDEVGATVTLLIEEIRRRKLRITPFEATVFGMGLYTDTGSFTFSTTTSRDLEAAAYLLEAGMNLKVVEQYSKPPFELSHQHFFKQLLFNMEEVEHNGLQLVISTHRQEPFQDNVSSMTRKLLDMTGADAVIVVTEMKNDVYVIGRARSKRIDLQLMMKALGGGGHAKAASATLKSRQMEEVLELVKDQLRHVVRPAITAKSFMNTPVNFITPETTMSESAEMMNRLGHSGLPVLQNGKLVGMISRRDLDKATRHGLSHAPVKAFMSSKVITVRPDSTFEGIIRLITRHNIGRLPVVNDEGEMVGIFTRSDIIEVLDDQEQKKSPAFVVDMDMENGLSEIMRRLLPKELYQLLYHIGEKADVTNRRVYLVGGIVRDILLQQANEDIDIVVEGDGISFAESLAEQMGGKVKKHPSFGTSTWEHPNGTKVDIASARLEYYDQPGALPHVEHGSLKMDLFRRDFTINALAIFLNASEFGRLIDHFNGREHLQDKTITVLHNLSFVEDPTRILRAVKFEVRFGFQMDDQTLALVYRSIDKISTVSKDRLASEFHKLLRGNNRIPLIKRLFEIGVWKELVSASVPEEAVMQHAQQFEENLNHKAWQINESSSWFGYMMLPFFGRPDFVQLLTPYAKTRKEQKWVKELHELQTSDMDIENQSLGDLHQQFKHLSEEALLFYFSHPLYVQHDDKIKAYVIRRREMPSLLNGEDLKASGIQPGPLFADILAEQEKAWMNGQISNKNEAWQWLKRFC